MHFSRYWPVALEPFAHDRAYCLHVWHSERYRYSILTTEYLEIEPLWSVNLGRTASSYYCDLDSTVLWGFDRWVCSPWQSDCNYAVWGVRREPDRHRIGPWGVDCAAVESEGSIRRRETGPSQEMPWSEKLPRAGHSALECGVVLPLDMEPAALIVGHQSNWGVILVYAISLWGTWDLPLPRFQTIGS